VLGPSSNKGTRDIHRHVVERYDSDFARQALAIGLLVRRGFARSLRRKPVGLHQRRARKQCVGRVVPRFQNVCVGPEDDLESVHATPPVARCPIKALDARRRLVQPQICGAMAIKARSALSARSRRFLTRIYGLANSC
jgi:hypothetical protein